MKLLPKVPIEVFDRLNRKFHEFWMDIEEVSDMSGWESEYEKIRNLKIACSNHARAALIKGKPETIV